jgi:hypothetical protein
MDDKTQIILLSDISKTGLIRQRRPDGNYIWVSSPIYNEYIPSVRPKCHKCGLKKYYAIYEEELICAGHKDDFTLHID